MLITRDSARIDLALFSCIPCDHKSSGALEAYSVFGILLCREATQEDSSGCHTRTVSTRSLRHELLPDTLAVLHAFVCIGDDAEWFVLNLKDCTG